MNEQEYWGNLEFRLCREFAGRPENHLRFLWCDGFVPQQYHFEGPKPRITGRAWIRGNSDSEWNFVLHLKPPVGSMSEIDWSSLLPAENVTRWLTVDLIGKRIEIAPSEAVIDQS